MKRKFKQLLKEQQELHDQEGVINSRLLAIKREILATCEHTEIEKKRAYSPGSYYDRSETSTWEVCTHCGKLFNFKVTHGGFG